MSEYQNYDYVQPQNYYNQQYNHNQNQYSYNTQYDNTKYSTQYYHQNNYYNNPNYNTTLDDISYSNNDKTDDSGYGNVSDYAPTSPNCSIETKTNNSEIKVNLSNTNLWSKFNDLTCEMILTKQGRRMFPTLQYELDGLDPSKKYNVFIDIIQAEKTTMKFQAGKWINSTIPANKSKSSSVYLHPESPNTGAFWMKNEIVFSKIKLTNNKKNPDSHMLLNSMHKYVPRLHIVEVTNDSVESNSVKTYIFPETKFVAVTAYQNTDVTQLKIDNNPFAKGFRDNFEKAHENSILTKNYQCITSSTPNSVRPINNYTLTSKVNNQNNKRDCYSMSEKVDYSLTYPQSYNYFQNLPTQYMPYNYVNYQSYASPVYYPTLNDSTDTSISTRNIKRSYQNSNENEFFCPEYNEKRQRI